MPVHPRRLARSAALAVAIFAVCAAAHADVEQTFEIDASGWTPQPRSMHLAGSFNGWSTSATPMQVNGGKVWSVKVKLEEGPHFYKFVADAGTPEQKWLNDPAADKSLEESDGNGGVNSGLIAGTDATKLPPAKPNDVNGEGIRYHPSDQADVSRITGDPSSVRVRVRALAGDVERCEIVYLTGTEWQRQALHRVGVERGLDTFAGIAAGTQLQGSYDGRMYLVPAFIHYYALTDGNTTRYLAGGQLVESKAAAEANPFQGPVSVLDGGPPAWSFHANWYQIFVERFRNGDASNDPGAFSTYERLVPWNGDWFKPQPGETPGDENFYKGTGNVWNRRLGGDLAGVREKLPYLRSLGVNAIYLNPIFEAESMHKYDTADFRHVDDNFGVKDAEAGQTLGNHELFNRDGSPVPTGYVETEDPSTWRWTKSDLLFLNFVKDAHDQGFRVVLDGVFNHVGRAHPYFQDVLKNGKRSPYASWFEITDFGDEKNWKELPDPYAVHGKPGGIQWRAWDQENGHLPVFKKNAETGLVKGPREHILAVGKRWLDPDGDPKTSDGADGWRLDVPGDIPHPFWIDFRTVCRAANPEAYIVGEIWSPAQAWVNKGDQFDATMNYQFAMAVQDFFVDAKDATTPTAFNDRLVKLWFMYPHASALAMQNLFDSHDTDRVASMFVNPDRPYDGQNRHQDNAQSNPYSERKPNATEWQRMLQLVAFQQTFLGAPMTYYGNEAGMWSSDDPNNRQPFPWADRGPYANGVGFNENVFAGHQCLIAIRNALAPLREGSFYPVTIDDAANVYAFGRSLGDEHVYVALNRSNQSREVTLTRVADGAYVDYADAAQVKVEMPMIEIATKRPVPVVNANAKAIAPKDGKLTITLPAHGVAILATKKS